MKTSNNIVSNKPFIKVLFLVFLIISVLWIASFFPDLVLTLIISALIAFALKPFVRFFEFKFAIKRIYAVIIIFSLLVFIISVVLYIFIPILISNTQIIYSQLKNFPFEEKLVSAAKESLSGIPLIDASTIGSKVHNFIAEIILNLQNTAETAAGYLINLVIIPFITYFILAEGDEGIKKVIERIPNKYFEMSLNVMDKLGRELISYLKGLLKECSMVGLLSTIGFVIIGVPNAIFIGIFTGVANVVPYIGPIAGTGVAIMATLMKYGDFSKASMLLILWGFIRLIDDLVLQPRFFGKSLNMHPVAVVLILIVGHQVMGVAGMVISIPIATILRVSATETYWGLKNYTITA